MKVKFLDIFYRQKVSAIILGQKGKFLINQLTDYGPDDWNFPGGGVEKGETEEEALLRELKEELGTDKFKILKKGKSISRYNWPSKIILRRIIQIQRFWVGQRVRYFLVKFTGKKDDIKPDPSEIRRIKWVEKSEFKKHLRYLHQFERAKKELKYFSFL